MNDDEMRKRNWKVKPKDNSAAMGFSNEEEDEDEDIQELNDKAIKKSGDDRRYPSREAFPIAGCGHAVMMTKKRWRWRLG